MLDALVKPPFSPFPAVTRASSRAARMGTFTLETWSRLLVDGSVMGAAERARELSWIAENLCALHGVRTIVRGAAPSQPSVLVANHISYFDPLVIACSVPLTAVAKREVESWPVVGEFCNKLGVLFVDRGDAQSGARVLREAMRALSQGVSVLVFPEGTTTRGDRVLPCKRGIFGAAIHAGVPVVPVALSYESEEAPWVDDDLLVTHYMRTIARPCTRVSVQFLPPLAMHRARDAEELADEARRNIARAVLADSTRMFSLPRHESGVFLASA